MDDAQVVVQRLTDGKRTLLGFNAAYARYVPTGHIVYIRNSSLFAVPFDLEA
jgi:hypothetical protein